jgi:hypothetical protein
MHKPIRALPAVLAVAAVAAAPTAASGSSAAGVGSSVQGRDSAGGVFSFAFDALAHSNSVDNNRKPIVGAYMYSFGDTFNCSGQKGSKPEYSFNTINAPPSNYSQNVFQPFPAVNASYQSFHYVFKTKYQKAVGNRNDMGTKNLGTVTVVVSGRIKQTSGPVGGPGKAIASGTIGMRVSGSCHTGTLKWTAAGSIVSPNPA